jgi:transposase
MLTRDQFQALYDQGPDALFAVFEQQQATIQALQEAVAALTAQVQELKARLDKDSHNSSKPPSSDGLKKKPAPQSLRPKTGRKPGGQPGHRGCTLKPSPAPDQVVSHVPATCAHCQQPLRAEQSIGFEPRQVHDLPPLRLLVTEHRALTCRCACGHLTTAAFPPSVSQPVQYGPRLLGLGLLLREYHLLPLGRTAQLLQQGFGASISVGTLSRALRRADAAVRPVTTAIAQAIRKAKRAHFDETGMRVAGRLHWLHSASTDMLTHYSAHAKRGTAAIEAAGILPGFAGTAVHDGWCSYGAYACEHALCNAHHLRELTGLAEQGQVWAADFKTLLTDAYRAVQHAKSTGKLRVHFQQQCQFERRYQNLLERGYAANPPPADPPRDRRGRVKQSPGRNLLCRLDQHRKWVLAFLYDFDIPFDNNLAERDLRMMKVRQKVSGGFRTLPGAEAFCRLRGYLSTLRKQGMALLPALEQLLVGKPLYPDGVTPK